MSAMVGAFLGAFCRGCGVAGEVQGLARGGAVAGARAAGHARHQGLVVAPVVAIAGGGCRYIRYMGYIAAQPCSGGDEGFRYIRYMTGRCSGCSGRRLQVRYMPVARLTCEFRLL
jgi:hypothetical protein